VRDEAVIGPVEVALGEVAIADRRASELARQPQQERLIDRSGHGLRAQPPVPALQPLDRARLALAGWL
jgi:hypothetical protein